jgi:hypothetical protein
MNLVEIELGGVDWIDLAQDRYRCKSKVKLSRYQAVEAYRVVRC